jgi:PAS domain S-box-containing protein
MDIRANPVGEFFDEIVFLRQRVHDLELQLDELKNKSGSMKDDLREFGNSLGEFPPKKDEMKSGMRPEQEALECTTIKGRSLEAALHVSEQKFSKIFENAPFMMHSIDAGGILRSVNAKWVSTMGFGREEVLGEPIQKFMTAESRTMHSRNLPEFWHLFSVSDVEYSYVKKDGMIMDAVLDAVVVDDPVWGKTSLSVMRDITDKKKAQEALAESELRYRQLFEISPVAMIVHKGPHVLFANSAASSLLQLEDPKEMENKDIYAFLDPGQRDLCIQLMEGLEHGEKSDDFRLVKLTTKNGRTMYVEWVAVETLYQGEPIKLSMGRDRTEVRLAEEKLIAGLHEKEVLLREIHHRVKNNLQIMSSLLRLQSRFASNVVLRTALRDTEQRLESMAWLHDTLYRSHDLTRIDFAKYINDMIYRHMGGHGVTAQVRVEKEMDRVELEIDTAIPCGLIANELVSNCFRHAFPDDRKGVVHIGLRKTSPFSFDLSVCDNGIGLPTGFDIEETQSFGFRLVQSLIKQLNGSMVVNGSRGAAFHISFPETRLGKN